MPAFNNFRPSPQGTTGSTSITSLATTGRLLGIGFATFSFFLTTSLLFSLAISRKTRSKFDKFRKNKKRRYHKKKTLQKKNDRVQVGIAAVVYNPDLNQILIGKRSSKIDGGNSWAFPGGWMEKGESFEGCALRELLEETGLNVKENVSICEVMNVAPFLNKLRYIHVVHQKTSEKPKETNSEGDDNIEEKFKFSVTTYVLVKLKPGVDHVVQIMEKDKCLEWKWIDANEKDFDAKLFPSLEHLLELSIDFKLF